MQTQKHKENFEQAVELLRNAKKIVIVTHQRPDGDAVGSTLALSHFLRDAQKAHDIFCLHKAPDQFSYLAHASAFTTDPQMISEGDHDVLVVLDSGDLEYAGVAEHIAKRKKAHAIINIDHHATNTNYGQVNIVDAAASSTSEILYHIFSHIGHDISQEMATCMLTGIIHDTGGFSNLATSSSSLSAASALMNAGARIWDIQLRTQKNKPIPTLKLWGTALSRLKKGTSGIVTTVLTQKDFDDNGANPESAEGIINFLNLLEDATAILMAREDGEGKVKISMRTTKEGVDVSRLAKAFGGGGHKKAAGFSIPGKIELTDKGWQIV